MWRERIKLIDNLISALSHLNGTRMPCKRSESVGSVSAICERIDCHEIEIEDINDIAGNARIQLYWKDEAAENELNVFAEVIISSPIKVRVSKNAKIIQFLKLSDAVTLCEPYGGLDGALSEAVFIDERHFYKRLLNREHKDAELKNGLFAKSAREVPGNDVTISPDGFSEQRFRCISTIMRPGWLAVCGGPGCGKTCMVAAAARELIIMGNCHLIIAQTTLLCSTWFPRYYTRSRDDD